MEDKRNEERLFDLEQEFIAADLRYRAAIKEHVKCCSARNWSEEKSLENKFFLAAHAFARALRERPDESATGERGEVSSAKEDRLERLKKRANFLKWEIHKEICQRLKACRRRSGDGTSERRADNSELSGR